MNMSLFILEEKNTCSLVILELELRQGFPSDDNRRLGYCEDFQVVVNRCRLPSGTLPGPCLGLVNHAWVSVPGCPGASSLPERVWFHPDRVLPGVMLRTACIATMAARAS